MTGLIFLSPLGGPVPPRGGLTSLMRAGRNGGCTKSLTLTVLSFQECTPRRVARPRGASLPAFSSVPNSSLFSHCPSSDLEMSSNPRLKRLLYFDPDPSSRDSIIKTVHQVTTMLTRRDNKRRLSPGADPLANVSHRVDVEVCLLGRRGPAFALTSRLSMRGSLQKAIC